jgi:hypothetical protein
MVSGSNVSRFLIFLKLTFHMKQPQNLSALSLAAMVLALTACGGGGSSSDNTGVTPTPPPTTAPAQTTAALQGIWQSAAGATATTSAIVLPDGSLWSVVTSGATTRLIKANLAVSAASFAGNGKSFTLGTTAVSDLTATASVVAQSSLSGVITETGTGQSEAYALTYQTRYDSPTTLANYTGNWTATLGPGTVSWGIDANGALSGSRTTGCTYSGQIKLRNEQKAVVDVLISENCNSTLTQLQGVAALSSDNTRLIMLMTTADELSGVVVNLARP